MPPSQLAPGTSVHSSEKLQMTLRCEEAKLTQGLKEIDLAIPTWAIKH